VAVSAHEHPIREVCPKGALTSRMNRNRNLTFAVLLVPSVMADQIVLRNCDHFTGSIVRKQAES
jgi:hypothetical protein